MNIILFDKAELSSPIDPDNPRIRHMQKILGLSAGDEFAAGIIGGLLGWGKVLSCAPDGWRIGFTPDHEPPSPSPITLILGCPRPPVARRLLKDMSSMGVKEIRFTHTQLNEKSYLQSKLWKQGLWHNALLEGAMQGKTTHLPSILRTDSLQAALADLPETDHCHRLAFDTGDEAANLSARINTDSCLIAIGPERGWSDSERGMLIDEGFAITRLGERILRTETACAVAVGIAQFLLKQL